ncbi:MAG: phosphoribosylformylglycinamidine synthase subunit PurL [Bdellovibrionales bacterium]|nr:phosphoribosylformylglycinamidine synthase subunit PurL [Bdellovibrionales bacterium]
MELKEKLKHYRISQDEYEKIKQLLGREPAPIEWPLFSALWSEHCSYKSSKVHLRKFSYRNAQTRDDSEENAGLVDLGYGEKIIFKMESHNHPSFIEPFQGAATGVGGILRDIFTMGARPIALADYLCFGKPEGRMKYLEKEVVHGISSYGNCVGVPTVTGHTEYDPSYDENILVNAMAVGLVTSDMPLASSKAEGVGNLVVYVGAKTGKDGVHGAAMASESFDENNDTKKPNIQIGDPFYEKLLIESCLEVLDEKLVIAMQDMGAAGITSSSFEMAAKGQVGFDIHLDKVPIRDSTLTPEEILLSESQERMLLVCEPKNLKRIQEVFGKWDLEASQIGEVNSSKKMKLFWKGDLLTEIEAGLIVDSAPRYERPYQALGHKNQKSIQELEVKRNDFSFTKAFQLLLKDPFFASKEWIYEQYDQRVGLRTVKDARNTLALMRLPSARDLAISLGCRPAFMRLDTQIGAKDALLYPALQMSVKGIRSLAVTDCLNFGNPEKLPVMSDFVATVDIYSELAKKLDAPVISGNVSFYNETRGSNITPTPAIGMIGIKENDLPIPECFFHEEDLEVYLLSPKYKKDLVISWAKNAEILNQDLIFSGDLDINYWADVTRNLRAFVESNRPEVSRVVGAGGLAMTLKKMCTKTVSFKTMRGISSDFNMDGFWLEERLYEFVFAIHKKHSDSFLKKLSELSDKNKMEFNLIGYTHKGEFDINFLGRP